MAAVPLGHGLLLAAALLAVGLAAVLARRNLLFILMGIEIMLNAAALAFVAAGATWGGPDAQVMFIFILTVAAAEVAVGLALVLRFHRRRGTVDADAADRLRG
jgi:NADH-quinone oxidoreductase subunit K